MRYFDKNGLELEEGHEVLAPEPDVTDIHQHEFVGKVIGFRNGYAVVEDGDNNSFSIEPERLFIM